MPVAPFPLSFGLSFHPASHYFLVFYWGFAGHENRAPMSSMFRAIRYRESHIKVRVACLLTYAYG